MQLNYNNNSILFVTAFKDLGRGNWGDGFKRDVKMYFERFKNLTKCPIRLICYCDEDISMLLNIECGFYDTYDYDEADSYFKFSREEADVMESDFFKGMTSHRKDPEVNKVGYNLVQHNKYYFLDKAAKLFPNYAFYSWIDFGYIRNFKNIPAYLNFNSVSKDTITYAAFKKSEIITIPTALELCITPNDIIQGSMFICPKELIPWISEEYYKMVMYYYSNNLVDDDQALIQQVYNLYPDRFTLIYTDKWFDLLNKFKKEIFIDVMIPTCDKDINTLSAVIKGVRKNVANLRNVYVVCKTQLASKIKDAIFFDEALFPFTIDDVAEIIFNDKTWRGGGRDGPGWWYQQLLKLYACNTINGISNNVLIVDSETIFYNKYESIKNSIAYYAVSNEISLDYRRFISLVLPNLKIFNKNISGICHQMLFQNHIIQNLFDKIHIEYKSKTGVLEPIWKIFVLISKENGRCEYSEYDLYFNFILHYYSYSVKITNGVSWDLSPKVENSSSLTYLTCHSHMRDTNNYKKNTYFCKITDYI